MLITPEWNEIARSALRRFVEDTLGYILVLFSIEFTIELKRTGFEPFKHSFSKQRGNLSFLMSYIGIDRLTKALQNGENRSSLAASVLKLFEKWPRPPFF